MDEESALRFVVHAGRLPAMQDPPELDVFDRARIWAGAIVLLAGLSTIVGSAVDWVSVTPPPEPPPGVDFDYRPFAGNESSEPFSGLEVREGWVTAVAGAGLMAAGLSLIIRKRGGGLAVLSSIPIGAVAISSDRALGSPTSSLMERTDTVGDADPALGLTLLAAGALVGLIAGVIGMAATPKEEPAPD